MSESTMQKVDTEIRKIVDEQYSVARKIIEDNSEKMHAMATALLEWETIDAEQIDDIAQGKPPRAPKSSDNDNSSDKGSGPDAPKKSSGGDVTSGGTAPATH